MLEEVSFYYFYNASHARTAAKNQLRFIILKDYAYL